MQVHGRRRLARLGPVLLLMVGLGACDDEKADDETELSPPVSLEETIDRETPLEELIGEISLEPGTVLAEASGRGGSMDAEFATDGHHAFRAVCDGGGTLRVTSLASGERPAQIPCNRVVTGLRYVLDTDVEAWSLEASPAQEWSIVWVDWDPREG
ncbi:MULTISPECIES: hypothetical protein [Aeromicrobium]|uniref:hypothetical protein n=1 Tax=Aeromicrobium TaxID=2040 RepID=UPI00257CC43B|nr:MULTISPECIES: hypothetical protein [Aeromicrobium]